MILIDSRRGEWKEESFKCIIQDGFLNQGQLWDLKAGDRNKIIKKSLSNKVMYSRFIEEETEV